MYSLSGCADTLFRTLPFTERVRKIAAAGVDVEFWNWKGRNVDAFAVNDGIRISGFTGYTTGCMVHPDGVPEFIAGVQESLAVASRLRCKVLFISSGELDSNGQVAHPIAAHPATRWITAYKTLCRLAELAEKHDVIYAVEHLNTKVDHPGFPFALVQDTLNLLIEVGSPRIKLLLDIYHAQVQEGNLLELIRGCQSYIGHVHVADVPGRHEPGTGEINYPRIAQLFRELGYAGAIGLEAFPAGDDLQAINRFCEVFS